MKRLLHQLLAVFGLVSARRFAALSRQLEESKAGSAEWKVRFSAAADRLREAEARLRRQSQAADKLRLSVEKFRQRQEHVKKLRSRLADAERELMAARDHLMAIEVKLDILEGAANVLDRRMRDAGPTQPGGTSATA
jgi:chromosome segregation ATPase